MAAYAASLVAERDYYRAISTYKYLAFTAPDMNAWRGSMWQIANAYRASGRHEHAIHSLTRLRNAGDTPSTWRNWVSLGLGASYLGLRLPQVAQPFLEGVDGEPQPELRLLLAISEIQRGQLAAATSQLRALEATPEPLASHARRLQLAIDENREAPRRAPWLAGVLSALIPGAGQLYTGHPVDALQAFGFVGAFGFASYIAYRYDQSEGNPYVLTSIALLITALFHAANVVGAVRTAEYHEQRNRENLIGATAPVLANIELSGPSVR